VFVLLGMSECKTPCFDTVAPGYEVDIEAVVTVRQSDGRPIPNHPVRVELTEFQCGGDRSSFPTDGETDKNGIFRTFGTWTFTMNNLEDAILVQVYDRRSATNVLVYEIRYSYDQLRSFADDTKVVSHTFTP